MAGEGVQTVATVGILLSKQGNQIEKAADIASTLMARDYKGFGNQTTNGVLEWKKQIVNYTAQCKAVNGINCAKCVVGFIRLTEFPLV